MLISVLGSAAGGGFPQWNCNCRNCRGVRAGEPGLRARTQASLAISSDQRGSVLLNASPDIRQQIAASPFLWPTPSDAARSSPVRCVVLTGAEVDQIAGLLSLREQQPFALYATTRVLSLLAQNPIFEALPRAVERIPIVPGRPFVPAGCVEMTIEAFAVPGKVPLYLEEETAEASRTAYSDDDTTGLKVTEQATGRFVCYVPACADVDQALCRHLSGAACIFFDGTLFTDDELIVQGLSQKTGRRMSHIAMSGSTGAMAKLRGVEPGRKIFIHINNSNPVLQEHGTERKAVEDAGWEVGYDGMEIEI